MRNHPFISARTVIATLMSKKKKTQQAHIWAHRGHGQVPRRPLALSLRPRHASNRDQTSTAAVQPERGRARGGRVQSGSGERHWDSWGKEVCWARIPLVARPYNLERCMQRTARSPFQVEIQEEPRPNLTGTTGEPASGQVKFPAGCQ